MSGSLIIYSSTDGHTKIICEKIKSISKNNSSIKIISLSEVNDLNLQIYEHIIIGASIRYGKHDKNLYKFISLNNNWKSGREILVEQSSDKFIKDNWISGYFSDRPGLRNFDKDDIDDYLEDILKREDNQVPCDCQE